MMKYWKTIGLTVCIIAIFTIFYVQMKQEIETYPTFTIHTNEGDLDVVRPMTLYGDYQTDDQNHLFSFNLGETMYVQQMPYLERLSGFYKYAEMERLEELYPGYMRGKNDDLSMYSESDQYVVQADMDWGSFTNGEPSDIAFNLSVLHKELQKDARMHIPVPEADQSSFITLEKMYAVGENLHIVTSHQRDKDDGMSVFELHVYTVQLDRGKIGSSDVVYTWEQDNVNEEILMTPIENNQSVLADQRMLLLQTVTESGVEIEDELTIDKQKADHVSYELVAYDFRTKSLETYDIPSDVKDGAQFISYENNSDVFLMQEYKESIEIIEWQLGSDEQPEPSIVPTKKAVQSYTTSYRGEYLYVYVGDKTQNKHVGEIHVLYVPTGEWVYAGDIKANRSMQQDEDIIIHSLE